MSTSNALPVLRTPDLLAAHRAVLRLLDLAIPMEKFQVDAEAQALTPAEAQRLVAAFPDALFSPDDPYRPETNDEVRRMAAAGDPRTAAPSATASAGADPASKPCSNSSASRLLGTGRSPTPSRRSPGVPR